MRGESLFAAGCSGLVTIARRPALARTIATPIRLEGHALLVDEKAGVTLCPSRRGTGIVFQRHWARIPLTPHAISDDPDYRHTTVMGEKPNAIHTVEHLLATLAGIGIADVTVVVDDVGHIPFFDGSCAAFVEAILRRGVILFESTRQRAIRVLRPLYVQLGESWARVLPSLHDTLSIDATIEFPSPIGTQRLKYVHDPSAFCRSLARARTFMSVPWHGAPIRSCPGMMYDSHQASTTSMLTHDGKRFHPPLRMSDECVRHKIADMIGDLAMLGMPLVAEIETFRPGHALSRQIVRAISEMLAVEPFFGGDYGDADRGNGERMVATLR